MVWVEWLSLDGSSGPGSSMLSTREQAYVDLGYIEGDRLARKRSHHSGRQGPQTTEG